MKNVSDNFNAEFYVLSECVMKNITFHLRKQSWPSYDLQFYLHQKLKPTILCPPPNPTTFVWTILLYSVYQRRYSGASIKMGHGVYPYVPFYLAKLLFGTRKI